MSRLSNSSGVPTLCYVTDRSSLPGVQTAGATAALRCRVAAAAAAGVDWIQIREKNLSGGDCVLLTREALQLAASATASDATPTRILVNDRLDVALSEGAGGVHLGNPSFPRHTGNFPCHPGTARTGALISVPSIGGAAVSAPHGKRHERRCRRAGAAIWLRAATVRPWPLLCAGIDVHASAGSCLRPRLFHSTCPSLVWQKNCSLSAQRSRVFHPQFFA